MTIYDRFGVRTRINAAGLLTRLGGSLMPVEVLEAMAEAAGSFVDMAELQATASRVIARESGMWRPGSLKQLSLPGLRPSRTPPRRGVSHPWPR
jgi:seryl-tRNA(Sec) selenium transferase